jgi:hypothetical protein
MAQGQGVESSLELWVLFKFAYFCIIVFYQFQEIKAQNRIIFPGPAHVAPDIVWHNTKLNILFG